VGALAIGLKDASPETRAAAAALRRLGPDAREALLEIQQVLQDKATERATRVQCALAVGRIGAPDALPALKEVVGDAKAPFEVRKAAAEALGQLGRDAAPAASALGQALTAAGTDYRVRREATAVLDAIGPDGRDALPDLIKALKDEDKYVRCHSLRAIGRYGKELGPETKTAVTALLHCLDDSVLDVRVAAIETFGAQGAEGLGTDLKAVRRSSARPPPHLSKRSRACFEDIAVHSVEEVFPPLGEPAPKGASKIYIQGEPGASAPSSLRQTGA
jgi:HEAT repeat protein